MARHSLPAANRVDSANDCAFHAEDKLVFERARLSRDPRFDGRFFTGVLSTGIYCRSICPAPAPKPENVVYYPSAAAAAQAGLRPCLRCRPESAPDSAAWLGTEACIRRAMRLIREGALNEHSTAELACRLGISDRHLRRLFARHVGASPKEVANTQRLLFARTLLRELDLPVAQLALASGFNSVRQFNTAFRNAYQLTPSQYRRQQGGGGNAQSGLRLQLTYRPPYHWPAILGFFEQRAIPGVEQIVDGCYHRLVQYDGNVGLISVRAKPDKHCVELELKGIDSCYLFDAASRVRRMFDLDASPDAVAQSLVVDPALATLVQTNPGLRLPGAWEPFELAVRAVLGQQVSVKAARTFAERIVRRCGQPLLEKGRGLEKNHGLEKNRGLEKNPGLAAVRGSKQPREQDTRRELTHAFPRPQDLLAANLDNLGLTGRRIATLKQLASAVIDGELSLSPGTDSGACITRLISQPGIGPWTANYIAMRALSEPDAFPEGDLGLVKAMQALEPGMTAAQLTRRAQQWRPWRAYAVMYLWLTTP